MKINQNLFFTLVLSLLISTQVMAKKQNTPAMVNPLIAYWNFDEIVDNKIKDQTGNGHDAKVSGGVLDEGKLGKAILFSAAEKNFVHAPNAEQFNLPNKQHTIMAWVKPRGLNQKGTAGIVNFPNGYAMAITNNRLTYADSFWWDFCAFGSYGQLELNKWQHLAAVRNGDKVTLYIDGKEIGTRIATGDVKQPSKAEITMGAQSSEVGYFDGWIDEVAIFGTALTPNAIRAKAMQGAAK